ncbi:MAG: erythromycin esterase family protein [Bacteroidetes bacterium]|nr:MAG: erythromycin esterase family protein [Bacteroidota bacterium]
MGYFYTDKYVFSTIMTNMKLSLKLILLLLITINGVSFSQELVLQSVVASISSENPESSFEDIMFLEEEFKNKKVISIGESTHGTHEFALMRHKIFKYLVQTHGFNTIFLEDEYSRCLLIDEYIKGRAKGNGKEIIQNFRNWTWFTEEMLNLIEWMRWYNQQHPDDQLNFIGVDMQDGNHMIQEINRLLSSYNSDIIIELPEQLRDKVHEKWSTSEVKDFDNTVVKKLNVLMESIKFSEEDRNVILRLAMHLEQYKIDHAEFGNGNTAYRDFCMGENIIYAMKNNTKLKGLFIAHNAHIAKVYEKKKSIKKSYGFAGGVLDAHFGDKHLAIAQEFDEGSFNAYYTKKKEPVHQEDFELMEITIEKSIDNSIASEFRNTDCSICYIPMKKVANIRSSKNYTGYKKAFHHHTIGGRFFPAKDNEQQTLEYIQSFDETFDAFILFKKSTASNLIRE